MIVEPVGAQPGTCDLELFPRHNGPPVSRLADVLEVGHVGILRDGHVLQEGILRLGRPQDLGLALVEALRLDVEAADLEGRIAAVQAERAAVVADHLGGFLRHPGKSAAQRRRLPGGGEPGDGRDDLRQLRPLRLEVVDPEVVPAGRPAWRKMPVLSMAFTRQSSNMKTPFFPSPR